MRAYGGVHPLNPKVGEFTSTMARVRAIIAHLVSSVK
jgi:hypothetical protein